MPLRMPLALSSLLSSSLSWLLTWLLLSALGAAPVAAQSQDDLLRAKESFKAGATAYAAGEYLAAIQALDAAYALTPLPAIAFSLGQAERRQYFVAHDRDHLERAIALFRRYVEQVPSGGRRADALDALSQLEPLAIIGAPAAPGGSAPAPTTGPQAAAPASRPPPARPTRLMITSETPGAELSLDGGPPVPSPLIREVDPGEHRVDVAAIGFFPIAQQVTAVAGELIPVPIALRERPSTLTVEAGPDAEVYVDGTFAGRGGAPVTLLLPDGRHRMTVAQKGHRTSTRTLDLERGGVRVVSVALEPTRQRTVALAMFAAGGVALAGGVVFGGVALRAQDRAQTFLDRQMRQNVTSGDLVAYQDAVNDRDRARVAATIGFTSAVGLLAAGLILYEWDSADPHELLGPGRLLDGSRPPLAPPEVAQSHIGIAPLVLSSGFGLSLGIY